MVYSPPCYIIQLFFFFVDRTMTKLLFSFATPILVNLLRSLPGGHCHHHFLLPLIAQNVIEINLRNLDGGADRYGGRTAASSAGFDQSRPISTTTAFL